MNKKDYFIKIFKLAEKKYKPVKYRLAAEGWDADWKVLISTIMSAQTKDETTIPAAEALFKKYPTLEDLAVAKESDVLKLIRPVNYNRTKSKHVIKAAEYIIKAFDEVIPDDINQLTEIPGVGRKTANLVITEVFGKEGICVDTHVHRISNVFGFVKTKSPDETEKKLKELIPQKYWTRINRYFVLWGKEVPGKNKEDFLAALKSKNKDHYIYQ